MERVAAGEQIIIARHGKPIAKLVPFTAEPHQPGRLKGKLQLTSEFDAPLPEAIAAAFRGEQA